jgi:acyl carrier protein
VRTRVRYTIPDPIMENIKQQLKVIIIEGLRITDRGPESLRDDEPLLDGDLGIDSIDILQLILEIERNFDIKLVDGEFDKTTWKTINTLTATVEEKLAAKGLAHTLQA